MAPPISILLSQYETLHMLCSYLSSADVIHLAATSKAHWNFIAENTIILKHLISIGRCDGSGIARRARYFLYWDGDEGQATYSCLESKDAKPCSDCGALVCDNCRFRFLDGGFASNQDEDKEHRYASHLVTIGAHDIRDAKNRAALTLFESLYRVVCNDCHPLLDMDHEDDFLCRCHPYSHFMGSRRLCLPCFFVEVTRSSRRCHAVRRDGWSQSFEGSEAELEEPGAGFDCECGKPGTEGVVCRICHRFQNWPAGSWRSD
ncbi:hypothetical protein Slin15195_G013950 [Septoria linicola]|uniref:F-box domain-containing protein n=1 Tax=Septoria linicola TaxID=215465 RepID=A0A9Q9EDT5_9PEZI|nr:hypothetical protein Slin15195_G013950 [Septoria linicola]